MIFCVFQESLDSLYKYRDLYFSNHDHKESDQRAARINAKKEESLKIIETASDSKSMDSEERAKILYFKGRALNVMGEADPEAEEVLSKAVKLDPTLVEAWNELGECYWQKAEIDMAKTCFEEALKHGDNAASLRNMSIVLRQKSVANNEEKLRNIELGLTKAREAVQLDSSDGSSWEVLGNAYLAHFFSVSQNPRTLKQAVIAYKQAEKDQVTMLTSGFHYNKGIAMKYEENYKEALHCFERAVGLDPTWNTARVQLKSLVDYLTEVKNLIELKGKLKTKRFLSLVNSIDPKKGLGPMAGSNKTKLVTFSQLKAMWREEQSQESKIQQESNSSNGESPEATANKWNARGCVILGKVTCSVHSGETVPFTFCLTDSQSDCLAVNLYNLSPGKGVIIGDSVAIVDPIFSQVEIERNGKSINFGLIRVESPLNLVINGKKASRDLEAGAEMSTFMKPS